MFVLLWCEIIIKLLLQFFVLMQFTRRVGKTFLESRDFFPTVNEKCIFLIHRICYSRSISFNHSSHTFPVVSWSSPGVNGCALRFLLSVIILMGSVAVAGPCSFSSRFGITVVEINSFRSLEVSLGLSSS